MDLHFIKTKACPHCGCNVVISESVEPDTFGKNILTHCNGGRWETRTFLCGYRVRYIPNFCEEEESGECKFSREYVERQEKRSKAEEALKEFIGTLDCDDDFKRNLQNHFAW